MRIVTLKCASLQHTTQLFAQRILASCDIPPIRACYSNKQMKKKTLSYISINTYGGKIPHTRSISIEQLTLLQAQTGSRDGTGSARIPLAHATSSSDQTKNTPAGLAKPTSTYSYICTSTFLASSSGSTKLTYPRANGENQTKPTKT